jgi:hypothetical protein
LRRIDDQYGQISVRRHLHQAVAQLAGGDAGDGAAKPAAAPSARGPVPGPFAAFGAGLGEVEAFNRDCPRAVLPGGGDESADRRAQPSVSRGCG